MKCCACNKEIVGSWKYPEGKVINMDGDFVCDDKCEKKLHEKIDRFCKMTDEQFNAWMRG